MADAVMAAVRRYWGFDALRPLQAEAIAAALDGRDALVVMPTGGGKSLCYQVPPLIDGATDIVVSPLISLMKDQVDALAARGYPALCVHSGLDAAQRQRADRSIRSGACRLVFVAPERLMNGHFLSRLEGLAVRRFAIDEAHCISQWGHDFRPHYRKLATLRDRFPSAAIQAFTATATPRVRRDIAEQLRLREPAELVGRFDRPNLVYRVLPKRDADRQVLEAVRQHEGEASIVYCISRAETERMAAMLKANGVRAGFYHAGMEPADRRATQEAFAAEELDVVTATVAFGMGIDRSNVRCVIHAAMPKSIEHYQQETGRAGRDGLEAECVLLYSTADAIRWESLINKSAEAAHDPATVTAAQLALLRGMQGFCTAAACRHEALSAYFGQQYAKADCGACDVCLNEIEGVADATVLAQKILSCVARTDQRFGVGHVTDVLLGANTKAIRQQRHNELSTFGLLREMNKKELTALTYQLVDQGVVDRTEGDRPVLKLNDSSWQVMRGQRAVRLIQAKKQAPAAAAETDPWAGVDRDLFDALRDWRRRIAKQRGAPPFTIMHDTVLRDLARIRPTGERTLRSIRGIGERQHERFGAALIEIIADHCRRSGARTDVMGAAAMVRPPRENRSAARRAAFAMFTAGDPLEKVAAATQRAASTVSQYAVEWIKAERPADIGAWVDQQTYQQVAHAARRAEDGRLKPIFESLGGRVPYETVRLVLAHLRARQG